MLIQNLHRIGWLIALTLLQVFILNRIHILGYATPYLYIYLILKLDTEMGRNAQMLWAFFAGLAVDIFADTPGMNAAATVLLAFLRPTLLRMFMPRDVLGNLIPSFDSIGVAAFVKYLIIAVLLHHTALITLEYFSLYRFAEVMLRVFACSLLTVVCILAIEGVIKKR